MPLAMTVANVLGVEWFDWVDPLLTAPICMQDGFAFPNEAPGWGFQFKDEHLVALSPERSDLHVSDNDPS